jgi:hypothetical protein
MTKNDITMEAQLMYQPTSSPRRAFPDLPLLVHLVQAHDGFDRGMIPLEEHIPNQGLERVRRPPFVAHGRYNFIRQTHSFVILSVGD